MMVKIRASSLGELFDCAARWEAKHLLNMPRKTNTAAFLGTCTHAGTAAYDQSILDGSGLSIDDCKAAIVDTIQNPKEEVDWSEDTPKSIEMRAMEMHERYCKKISPRMDYIAIELTCEPLILQDLGLELTGSTDRIYKDKYGDLGIMDIKTGKNAVSAKGAVATSNHAAQIGVYEILAEKSMGKPLDAPAGIIGINSTGDRIGVGTLTGARDLLLGDEYNDGLLSRASKIIHTGSFNPNPSSYLCGPKYCPRYSICKFHK